MFRRFLAIGTNAGRSFDAIFIPTRKRVRPTEAAIFPSRLSLCFIVSFRHRSHFILAPFVATKSLMIGTRTRDLLDDVNLFQLFTSPFIVGAATCARRYCGSFSQTSSSSSASVPSLITHKGARMSFRPVISEHVVGTYPTRVHRTVTIITRSLAGTRACLA